VTEPAPLRQRDIARFYLPLLLNVQLMSVSHTIINGVLARGADPVGAIAAFGVALSLHLVIASVSFQNHTVTLALVRDRQTLAAVCRYAAVLAGGVMLAIGLLAYTSLGEWAFRRCLGVSAEVARGGRQALQVLMFLPLFTGIRGIAQGLLIQARRTTPVSAATGIRIGVLLLLLPLAGHWLTGPQLGAFGLVGCIAVEAVFSVVFAWRGRLPWQPTPQPQTTAAVFRFGLPLACSTLLGQALPLLVCAIISRFADGTTALAGFAVIRGFLFLLAGPQRNLQQAWLTLVHTAADHWRLLRFNLGAGTVLAGLMLLLAGPCNAAILGGVMGLKPAMRGQIALPMALCAIFPLGVGLVYQLAGRLTRSGQTGRLGRAVLLKLGWLGLFWLGMLLTGGAPPWPGLLTGLVLFLSAQWLELGYLYRHRPPLPA